MNSKPQVVLNEDLCQECGGRCCQGSPGVWADPERFLAIFFGGRQITLEELRSRLTELGLVLWEKSGVPVPAPLSLQSGCAFWGAAGCRLSLAERPCQCLALLPSRATLEEETGCRCRLPEEFSQERVWQRWRMFWEALPSIPG